MQKNRYFVSLQDKLIIFVESIFASNLDNLYIFIYNIFVYFVCDNENK